MGGTRLASDGTPDAKIIANAIRDLIATNEKLQKSNAKATKKYLIITVIATFVSAISGILIGKLVLV